ncbi:hypothetical protein BV898_01079 [Hypsibius exemplaris]|uniref:Uncharacterized protein n=1 Tax=Hypsibius exemplaris TaxID=2072580 RepID=A0A1W0XD83_HYPEX|nr:hypothetical protein BV898_01079 [Hypsibius exemplaris]
MAYQQRTEYHREVNRDDDRDQNKSGGWKSWFGLGDNKDRDEDRDYNYKATTTYRNEHPSYGYSGQRSTYPERSGYSGAVSTGYSGARGGYGYTTSDEVNRGPSWNTDRDYTTRPSYGQPTGDREVYYKQDTRTYGGQDREYRPTGDYTSRSYTPSRSYGFSGDYTGRDYTPSRYQTDRDYTPAGRGYGGDRDYSYSRTYTTGGDRDCGYGYSRNTGYGYGGPEPTSRSYGYGDSRSYPTGYTGGYGGYGETNTYTRPSYQPSSYRY